MRKLITFVIGLLFAGISNVFAHNLWIETPATGTKGKEQTAKIYLGGYGENERDSTAKWFGNTREFVLWLTSPDGTKKQLITKAAGNCFESTFIPDQDGIYTLSLSLELSEVYGTTKYQYYAAAQVSVGAATNGRNNLASATDLSSQFVSIPVSTGKSAVLKIQYKGQNLEKAWCSVASPAGWVKNFETDKDGTISFQPLWPGLYVIEAFNKEKTSGTVGEKKYEAISHIATYSFTIGK